MLRSKLRIPVLLGLLGAMITVSGCGDDFANNDVTNKMFDKRGTLQGKIFDATTGDPISGTDLKLTLIQGADRRSPNVLITDDTDTLRGEYAFTNVPVALSTNSGNITYKLVVDKPGYQHFEGNVVLSNTPVAGVVPNTNDKNFNFIGNVYLFPFGVTAPDYKVVVEHNGEPVIGAQVILQQNATTNAATTELSSAATRIAPTAGLLPTLRATTVADANGQAVATFAGATLVLGGKYTPTVLPLTREGIQLAMNAGGVFTVGTAVETIVVAMGDLEPGAQTEGIHVVFASNRDASSITGLTNAGRLILVFNRPIAIAPAGNVAFTATLGTAGGAVLNAASATGSLSADGLTLTIDPSFSTAPVAADLGVNVVFAGGSISVQGDEGTGVNIQALRYRDGTVFGAAGATVNILGQN